MVQTRSMTDPTAFADLPPACCTRSRTKAPASGAEPSKKRPREEEPDDQHRRPTKKPAVTKPRTPTKTASRAKAAPVKKTASKKAATARKPSKIATPGTTVARSAETTAGSSRKRPRPDDEVDEERPNKKPAPSPLPSEPRITRSRAAAQQKAKVAAAAAARARLTDSAVDVNDGSGPVVASANGAKPPGGGSSGEESDPGVDESDDTYESSTSSDSSEESETEAEESRSESEESGSGSEEEEASSGSEQSNPNSNAHVPCSNYPSSESDSVSTDSSSALPPSTADGDVLPPRGALLCSPCLSELLVSHFRAQRLQQLRAGRLQALPGDYIYSDFATSLRNALAQLANNAWKGEAFFEFDSKLAAAAENVSLTSLINLTLPNDRLADDLAHWDATSITATIDHLWRRKHDLGTTAGSRCPFGGTLQAARCYQCLDTPSGHPDPAEDDSEKDHFRTFADVARREGMTLEQLRAIDVRLFAQLLQRKYGYPLCFSRRGVCLAVDPCGARPFVVFLGVDTSG